MGFSDITGENDTKVAIANNKCFVTGAVSENYCSFEISLRFYSFGTLLINKLGINKLVGPRSGPRFILI